MKLYTILILSLLSIGLVSSQWPSSSSSSSSDNSIDGVHYLVGISTNYSRIGKTPVAFQYNFTTQYTRADYTNLHSAIFGMLECKPNYMTFVHVNGTGVFVKAQMDFTYFNVQDLSTIYVDNYAITPQDFGYDSTTDRAYLPLLTGNNLQVWQLDFQLGSTTLIRLSTIVKKGGANSSFSPVGTYDPSTGRYYVLYVSNNVYNLGIFNTKTKNTSGNVILFLPADVPADIVVVESKVFVLVNNGIDIYIYQVDPIKNAAKLLAYFDNSQSIGYSGKYYAVTSNRIVLFTNLNSRLNTATYIVFDPVTSLFEEIIGDDEIGAFNLITQACVI